MQRPRPPLIGVFSTGPKSNELWHVVKNLEDELADVEFGVRECEQHIKHIDRRLHTLETMKRYKPGGPGMLEAKEHFEALANKTDFY